MAVVLGLGRALGETMAVVMVIGNRHDLSVSLIEPGYTMAALVANEFNEAAGLQRAALFEVGLVLFGVTLAVNAFARLSLVFDKCVDKLSIVIVPLGRTTSGDCACPLGIFAIAKTIILTKLNFYL